MTLLERAYKHVMESNIREENSARLSFIAIFGVEPESIDGNSILHEGLHFKYVNHWVYGHPHFILEQECPTCDYHFTSGPIYSLPDLATASNDIKRIRIGHNKKCKFEEKVSNDAFDLFVWCGKEDEEHVRMFVKWMRTQYKRNPNGFVKWLENDR